MTLNIDGLEFDYHKENSDKFTKDFMNYVITDVPLFASQDELLALMNKRGKPKFRIPGYLTVDGHDHIFYFEIRQIPENENLKIYKYIGVDLEKRGLLRKD